MPKIRLLIAVVAILQILGGLVWLVLLSNLNDPGSANSLFTYGLLSVGCISLITQYNKFAIGFVVLANWLLAIFSLKGLVQHVPHYFAKHGFGFVAIFSTACILAPAILCLVNAYAIPRWANGVEKDSITDPHILENSN